MSGSRGAKEEPSLNAASPEPGDPGSARPAGAAPSSDSAPRPREVAWRLFTHELTSSSVQEKGEGEKATTHVLTPLGSCVSRLLLVGTLSQIEPLGSGAAPLWRARFTDPTGGVPVTAGSYQPRALAFLSQAKAPLLATVVGKAHLFVGREGVPMVSVRSEIIAPATPAEERAWVVETARQSLRRLALTKAVRTRGSRDPGSYPMGYPRRLVDSAIRCLDRYPGSDPERFRGPIERALEGVGKGAPVSPEASR